MIFVSDHSLFIICYGNLFPTQDWNRSGADGKVLSLDHQQGGVGSCLRHFPKSRQSMLVVQGLVIFLRHLRAIQAKVL